MKLRIKEVCQMRNTTQKELAEKLGVSEVTLSRASNGNTSLTLLEKIASALDLPLWRLFASPEDVRKEQGTGLRCPVCGAELELKQKEDTPQSGF